MSQLLVCKLVSFVGCLDTTVKAEFPYIGGLLVAPVADHSSFFIADFPFLAAFSVFGGRQRGQIQIQPEFTADKIVVQRETLTPEQLVSSYAELFDLFLVQCIQGASDTRLLGKSISTPCLG